MIHSTPLSRRTLRDLGGKVLREHISDSAGWRVERDYIYRDGLLLAAETPAGVRHFHWTTRHFTPEKKHPAWLLAAETPAGVRHFHLDHLGTPRLITKANRTIDTYHVYLPFGEEATAFSLDAVRMKFTGHERDLHSASTAADDLDYMHARYHRPGLGRFLSVDPVGASAKAGAPQDVEPLLLCDEQPLEVR